MLLKLTRTPAIYLVGFMACGKSTAGRLLAERLGWSYVDLDEEIEQEQGATIPEIFDTLGEAGFRLLETDAIRRHLHQVQAGRATVMALGGGAFAHPGNFELLEANGVTIWLDCPLEVLAARVAEASNRPLARDPEKFSQLYWARRPSYARAEFRIDAGSKTPEAIVEAILDLPVF